MRDEDADKVGRGGGCGDAAQARRSLVKVHQRWAVPRAGCCRATAPQRTGRILTLRASVAAQVLGPG